MDNLVQNKHNLASIPKLIEDNVIAKSKDLANFSEEFLIHAEETLKKLSKITSEASLSLENRSDDLKDIIGESGNLQFKLNRAIIGIKNVNKLLADLEANNQDLKKKISKKHE